MLTLTFQSAKDHHACSTNYQKFAEFKGGDKEWGMDKPFPLLEVLENNGFDDALWALRCCEPQEEQDKLFRLFDCDCIERVLPLFEKEFPENKRLRYIIEVARRLANGEATQSELNAAWADDWADAWYVARYVAGADEREWQVKHFKEMLSKRI